MKVFAIFCLVSVALCHDDQHQQFTNWAKLKAMESCWGEDNMKAYTVDMKKAVAKCSQTDAPELNLSAYRSPYKTVNVLLNSAEHHEQEEMHTIFQMMRLMKQYKEMQQKNMHNDYNSYRPYSNDYNRHDNNMMDDQWMAKMLMNIMMKNNMKNDMTYNNQHSSYSKMPAMSNSMDRLDSLEKMMRNYFEQKKQYGEHNAFKSNSNKQDKYNMFNKMYDVAEARDTFRYKRQAVRHSVPNLDLGDRFEAKLQAEKQKTTEKIGNMTCILQELNVLDKQNNIDITAIKEDMTKYKLPSQWFKTRYIELLDTCYKMATTLPGTIEKQYEVETKTGTKVHVAQIKTFMMCCAKAKGQLCMNQDLKQRIETNFGELNKILKETQLTEQELFPLVQSMLQGQDNEFDFGM